MGKSSKLKEDAAVGTTGSGSIAANYDRLGSVQQREKGSEHDWHSSIKDAKSPEGQRRQATIALARKNLAAAKEKMKKKNSVVGRFKSFISATNEAALENAMLSSKPQTPFKINENFNMQDVVSRLKGIQHTSTPAQTVSYGVEDDSGNMMKVTVKAEDSKEFEAKLAAELADAQDYQKVTGQTRELSMAELLFKLKDQFDIVDVQFPTIPKDAIYNADKVSYGTETPPEGGMNDMGMDAGGLGGDTTDPLNPEQSGEPLPVDGLGGGEGGTDELSQDNSELPDDGSVQDFPPETAEPTDEKSLLISVLNMLKADAEAKKAQADAEAEKARALQAEISQKAASAELSKQEEFARLEADMDKQKDKEKEARKLADLARFRVNSSVGEGTKIGFSSYLLEYADGMVDNLATLNKQKQALRQQYAPVQGDDDLTMQFKRDSFNFANREIDARIRLAQLAAAYKQKRDAAAKTQANNPQQPQQPNQPQQQQNQQPNNQQAARPAPNPTAPNTNTQPTAPQIGQPQAPNR